MDNNIYTFLGYLISLIMVLIPMILFFKYYHNSKRGGLYHALCFCLSVLFGPLGFIWILIMREYPEEVKKRHGVPIQDHETAYKKYLEYMKKR